MHFGAAFSYLKTMHNGLRRRLHSQGDGSMKRLAASFGLALLLLSNFTTAAQNKRVATDDSTAVRATVRDYIEAYYAGDAHRMEQTLHPHYLKHVIHGDIPMREMTGLQIVHAVRSQGIPSDIPEAERTEQVSVLDIAGGIASAKLVTPHWVDYMTLLKSEGGWKIVSVVQQIED
jgi:hypothetical protein